MIIYFASFSVVIEKKCLKTQAKFYLQINKTNQGTDFIFSNRDRVLFFYCEWYLAE